ncbi:MAG: RidA family protein [Candidatus Latescibacteria bacterium]|nr:RidA family protein [Candidatus Latescibacterota bacterium]
MKKMLPGFALLRFITIFLVLSYFVPGTQARAGVRVGKTVYYSGRGDYLYIDEDFPRQVRTCLGIIEKSLIEDGLTIENVVKCYVYLDDLDNFPAMNEVYKEFFKKDFPARTTLDTGILPGYEKNGAHVEITVIAYSDLSEKKVIGSPPPGYPFSPGILAGNTLYISGQGDHLPNGDHPATFEEQVRQSLRNVGKVLKEAGIDYNNVVMSHVFLDEEGNNNSAIVNKVYSEFFEYGNEPARATVYVDKLPAGCHVEITCYATTDLSNRVLIRPHSMKYGPGGTAPTASPGVLVGDTLHLSSQVGMHPINGIAAGDLTTQTHQMMQNHLDVLRAAGMGFEDLVTGYVYLRDMKDYRAFNALYNPYFSTNPNVRGATRTCVQDNSGYVKDDVMVTTTFIFAQPEEEKGIKGVKTKWKRTTR